MKKAFGGNREFDKALDAEFRSDSELYAFDKVNHCFKLSRVYTDNNN